MENNSELKESFNKYEDNRELVRDDNPYSRLYALKRMGIVENYEEISEKTVVVVGVGGVGSVTAEMLTRIGIGKLIMFDYDKVEIANMNRLFYTPNQVGLTKVDAAKLTLEGINPRTQFEAFNGDVTKGEGYETLVQKIKEGGIQGGMVDLVLSCVDNYSARMTVNNVCNMYDQIWIESGVSQDALSCHYQIMIPGETACFACMPPLAIVENKPQIKREGVCAASLPTTMSITAGLMTHTAMKVLLEFEEISYYTQYNARNEYFSQNTFRPNPECKDKNCIIQQAQKKGKESFEDRRQKIIQAKRAKLTGMLDVAGDEADEELEDWGIEIIEEDQMIKDPIKASTIDKKAMEDTNVEDLMAQFNNL